MTTDRRSAIYRYCNYQYRSQQEVKDRLYKLGSYPDEVGLLIAELIEADLLNEERFAKSFVRGKFKLKHWGRIKIIHELKSHRLSEYVLKKALSQINPSDYFGTAQQLGERKWDSIKEDNVTVKRGKVYRYLQQKGFESNIISEVLKNICSPK